MDFNERLKKISERNKQVTHIPGKTWPIAKRLEVEWGQLQLEQQTWAMHGRVEKLAAEKLDMRVPPPNRIQLIPKAAHRW